MTDAVLLIAHGSVDELDELPEFLTNIRRGRPPPAELLEEVHRRYEAIGGRSPLNAINRDLAKRLENRLGMPVRMANRMAKPYPKDVLAALAKEGVTRVRVVPLAQHSAPLYGEAVAEAAKEAGIDVALACAPNWGREPALTEAFARDIAAVLERLSPAQRAASTLLLTAHSLPMNVIASGDPYEIELLASAELVAARVRELVPQAFADHRVAFQSQGMSTGPGGRPMAWLGPDLKTSLDAIAAAGRKTVVVAPIGFLAEHVEILYDLDIEASAWAKERGLELLRAPCLDARDGIVEALVAVAQRLGGAP